MQYLAEFYVPRCRPGLPEIAGRAYAAAEQLAREGTPIRFLRAIFVPDDESCFALYEAGSLEAVAHAGERAELAFDRICEAAAVPEERSSSSGPTQRKEQR
jgi:hypothetical protein